MVIGRSSCMMSSTTESGAPACADLRHEASAIAAPRTAASCARRAAAFAVVHRAGCLAAIVAMLPCFLVSLERRAAADDRETSSTAKASPDGQQPAGPPPALDGKHRRDAAARGFLMLAGIILIGIVLLAFVALWGNRARRRARQALPQASRGDELWFLKPPKKPVSDDTQSLPPTPRGDSASDGGR